MVRLHQVLGQEEADAGSSNALRLLIGRAEEFLTHSLQVFLADTQSLVFNSHQQGTAGKRFAGRLHPPDNTDFAAVRRVLDGVVDDVMKDILYLIRVRLDKNLLRFEINDEGMLFGTS